MLKIISNFKLYIFAVSIIILQLSCSSNKIDTSENSNRNSFTILSDTIKLEQEARYFFINGINFQIQNKDAEAIIEFQEALQFDQSASIYYAMGKSFYNLFKKERAIENLKYALELEPNHLPALDLISDIYYFSNLNLAIEYNSKALDIDRSKERIFKQAILYETLDSDQSVNYYQELLENDKDNVLILDKLADIYLQNEDLNNALEILMKIDNLDPNNSSNFDKIISIYLKNNDLLKAIQYVKTKQLNFSEREYEQIVYELGIILYNSKNDVQSAINEYSELLKRDFKFSTDLQILGAWLSSKNKTMDLSLFINNALKSTDSLNKTLSTAIYIYNAIDDTNNALQLINKYNETIINDVDLLLAASFSLSNMNKDSKALEFLKKSLKLDSNNADIYSQIGFLYDKLGMVDLSDSSYIKALSIDPYHTNANNNYAYSLIIRDKNLDQALEMSKKVIESNMESSAYLDTYAWINFKLGNLDMALEFLLKAIELPDASSEVYEHLGIVQMEKGDLSNAKNSFKKALELEPTREISREKLEILNKK